MGSTDTHDLKVESRLTKLETTIDVIAEEVRNTSTQIRQTNESVNRLAMLAQSDRRLVKGFILAVGVMWGVAQFAVPLLRDDGTERMIEALHQATDKRVKALEDWRVAPKAPTGDPK